MPINAGYEYFEAEKKFQTAKSAEERLAALQEMLKTVPKHKGTETLIAEINKRIKKTREEIEKKQEQKKKAGAKSLSVKKEGAGQIVLVGLPNSGKSTVLKELTNANVEIASYPFTTVKPEVGMLNYKNALIQLVEVPAIVKGSNIGKSQGNELLSIVRNSDAVILVLNSEKPLREFETLKEELSAAEIRINGRKPKLRMEKSQFKGMIISGKQNLRIPLEEFKLLLKQNGYLNSTVVIEEKIGKQETLDVMNDRLVYKNTLILVLPHKSTNKEELTKLQKKEKPFIVESWNKKTKELLEEKLFELLGKILVYTKRPGEAAADLPLAVPKNCTIGEVAKIVHKEIAQNLKFARVWGSTKFGGQRVAKDYALKQGDIIEIYF